MTSMGTSNTRVDVWSVRRRSSPTVFIAELIAGAGISVSTTPRSAQD
jgi:hypothetical protein